MKLKSKARLKRDAKKAEQLFKHKLSNRVDRVEKAVQLADLVLRDNIKPQVVIKSNRPIPNHVIDKIEVNRLGWYQKSVFG